MVGKIHLSATSASVGKLFVGFTSGVSDQLATTLTGYFCLPASVVALVTASKYILSSKLRTTCTSLAASL